MVVRPGSIIQGLAKGASYRVGPSLKGASVFNGHALTDVSQKFIIKTGEPGRSTTTLLREWRLAQDPRVRDSPYFRQCVDAAGVEGENEAVCLVFERMDFDLGEITHTYLRSRMDLVRSIATAVLHALIILGEELNSIHSDVNPGNILITDLNEPQVKLADLGNVVTQGYDRYRAQSLATRAPEVWLGQGCWHSSDVWSLGVTLSHALLARPVFGADDKIVQGLTEAWCIAKIGRLVGPIEGKPTKAEYDDDFFVAPTFIYESFTHPDTGLETPFITVGTLAEELQREAPRLPPDLLDFLLSLLTLDRHKRPSARQALEHPFLSHT